MDVKLPDGRILRGVPDGTTKLQLAEKLKSNGIDVPASWFVKGDDPSAYGGTGGYNPMLSGISGLTQRIGGNLGMTPENTENPVANAAGPLEAAAQFASGAVATPVSGIAGLGQGIKNWVSPGMSAADRIEQVQQGMTYQPRTGAGAGMSRVAGAPLEAYAAGTNYLGEKTAEATGSPALGAAVKTVGDIAPGVIGARRLPKREAGSPRTDGTYTPKQPPAVPTTAELSAAAKQAYSDAKGSGVVVPSNSYSKALARIQGVIKEEGINNTLHPKTTALLKHLDEAAGKDLSITEAENLRRVIQEVAGDLDPVTRKPTADAYRANKILDEFDDAIDQLSVNSEARKLWARSRKSQMIDDMIHRAEIRAGANYTQAGMETALRQEFRQLAMNPRRMRGFTSEQRRAIEKVAKGGPVENTLRQLGKFDPTGSVVSAAGSIATGGMLAPMTGGASMALPAIGFVSKRLATRATARNVDAAREALVGRGMPTSAPRATAPTKQSGATATTPAAGQSARTQARTPDSIQADFEQLMSEAQGIQQNDPLGQLRLARIRLRMAMLEREMGEIANQGGR